MCGDGDLVRGNLGDAKATHAEPRVKGRRGPGRSGNTHVTANGFGNDSCTCMNVPQRWKASRVERVVSSSRRDEDIGLGKPIRTGSAKALPARIGSDRGVRGTTRSRALGRNTPRVNSTSPPKRIRHRETPGPPVSWSRVQARGPWARRKPRRETGSSRGAGTRKEGQWKAEVGRTHPVRAPRQVARQAIGRAN